MYEVILKDLIIKNLKDFYVPFFKKQLNKYGK